MESTAQGLDYILDEGGSNLSVGEKQLLCLGRAILRKSKILLIDEATANVDLNTDAFIQERIHFCDSRKIVFSGNQLFQRICWKWNSNKKQITELFKESTVLTIAHRLNTIIHSDRIVILEKGKVVEFDSPAVLINVSHSLCRLYEVIITIVSAKRFILPKSGSSKQKFSRDIRSIECSTRNWKQPIRQRAFWWWRTWRRKRNKICDGFLICCFNNRVIDCNHLTETGQNKTALS